MLEQINFATFSFKRQLLFEHCFCRIQLSHNFVPSLIKQLVLNKEQTMEMQTEDKPYPCVRCNLSFDATKDLKTHMLQHGGKKAHTCNQCGYSSISNVNLKKHMLIHSGEKPFSCKQCNYSSTQAGALKRHVRTHSGEKPFICTQCNYCCTSAGNLKTHIRTHSGENPFSCKHCDYSCTTAGHLKAHTLTHSGEKPFRLTSVTSPANKLVTSRHTCSNIQVKTLSDARNATTVAHQLGT